MEDANRWSYKRGMRGLDLALSNFDVDFFVDFGGRDISYGSMDALWHVVLLFTKRLLWHPYIQAHGLPQAFRVDGEPIGKRPLIAP